MKRNTVFYKVLVMILLFHLQCGYLAAQTKNKTGKTIEGKQLPEVVVSPDKIVQRGDTLIYSVEGFREAHDRTIEDVIKNLPGVKVSEEGRIYYNGIPISHLYVDGKDLMGGGYAMVTKSLAASKVRIVKAWKQKIRLQSLRKVNFDEEVSLNLVLKDEARNRWTGAFEGGLGTSLQRNDGLLRSVKAVEMFFGRKKQSISIYKHDNSGQNVQGEMSNLVPLDVMNEERSLLLAPEPGSLLFGGRNQFNNTHIVASNWLLDSKKNNTLRLQLSYLFDRSLSESSSETVYTDLGDSLKQVQTSLLTGYRSEVKGELSFSTRIKGFHVSNAFSGYANFNHSEGEFVLNGKESRLHYRPHRRGVHHHLSIDKMGRGMMVSGASDFYYVVIPARSLLANGTEQSVDMNSLRWQTRVGGLRTLGPFSLMVDMGTRLIHQELMVANTDTTGTQHYRECQLYVRPSVGYEKGIFSTNVGVDLYHQYQRLEQLSEHFFTASPSLKIELKPFKWLNWVNSWSRSTSLAQSIHGLTTLSIYANNATKTKNSGKMDKFCSDIIRSEFSCSLPLQMLYGSGGFSAMGQEVLLMGSTMEEGVYGLIQAPEKTHRWTYQLSGSMQKRFNWQKLSIGMNASYSWMNSELLVEKAKKPYGLKNCNLGVSCSLSPLSLLSLSGNCNYNRSVQDSPLSGNERITSWLNGKLELKVSVGQWYGSLKNEWQYSSENNVDMRWYADMQMGYRTKLLEVTVDVCNLLGYDKYESYTLLGNMQTYSVSRLRPRELMVRVAFNL